MTELTFRIEAASPLLSYSDGWSAGTSRDPFLSNYSDAAMMKTEVGGASVQLTFYGAEVEVFGAARANHGSYQAGVDGALVGFQKSTTGDLFQQSIFKHSKLSLGQHSLRLVNSDTLNQVDPKKMFLDVDHVVWKGRTGTDDQPTKMLTIQPDEEYFEYSEAKDWTDPLRFPVSTYFGSSGSPRCIREVDIRRLVPQNLDRRDSGCETYTGDAFALYGPVGPAGTSYGVRLNGGNLANLTSKRNFDKSQQMLFSANSLPGSRQTVELVFFGNPGEELSIDFANVWVRSEAKASVTPSPAVVFGLTFSAAVAFMAGTALLLFCLHYCFGWFPFLSFIVTPRRRNTTTRAARPDDPLPYPKELLPQFSPAIRRNGTPSVITFTEISEYPFSSSDYYAQTSLSGARTKSSKMTLSTSKTPRSGGKVSRTPKSGNSRSNNSHRPRMTAIHEGSNLGREGAQDSTPSSAIANSWMLRNTESEASAGSIHSEQRRDSAG